MNEKMKRIPLCEKSIRKHLDAADVEIQIYSEIDSTNAEARRLSAAGKQQPVLLLAEQQYAGRGRMGRSFYSPDGMGIYMTYLWQPHTSARDVIGVTTAAAVAVHRALCRILPKEANRLHIKWVNDLYLADKKICGILTEAVTDPADGKIRDMWIGIGINVAPMSFPPELLDIATTLGSSELDRNVLIAAIVNELLRILQDADRYAHMPYYRAHSMVIGKDVRTIRGDESVCGKVLDIDSEGGLVVERADGTVETMHSGEISLRLI
jgi:BirA family biotin operon repressor/biotin-[acetyl-CoA-carboxylase] ligase